ncbi:MAG: hypothetical protein RET84_19220 [Pseudomonadota bacterium]|nr:hypothetical protein [Pseudomonadota bacterium]
MLEELAHQTVLVNAAHDDVGIDVHTPDALHDSLALSRGLRDQRRRHRVFAQ